MAFDIANFGPLGGQSRRGKAPMWWTYTTTDAHTAVDAAGYFGSSYGGAYNHLEIGDVIYVCVTSAGALSTAGVHIVKDKASGTVDVTNVTAFVVTDSD